MINSARKQKGAGILLPVLIVGIALSIAFTAFLLILNNSVQSIRNQIKSEISYQMATAAIRETIISYTTFNDLGGEITWPSNPLNWPYTDSYKLGSSNITRLIENDGTGGTRITITAITDGSPQTISSTLIPTLLEHEAVDIILVIDRSGSMDDVSSYYDSTPKYTRAINAAKSFVQLFASNTSSRIGIISFSSQATADTLGMPTANSPQISDALDLYLDPNTGKTISGGSTNIGGALVMSRSNNFFNVPPTPSDRPRFIVFLTDGVPTVDEGNYRCIDLDVTNFPSNLPSHKITYQNKQTRYDQISSNLQILQTACLDSAKIYATTEAEKIKYLLAATIFTIGLGVNDPTNPQNLVIDEGLLKQMASINEKTNLPYYYHSPDASALEVIYNNIAKAIVGIGRLKIQELQPKPVN